MLLRAVASVKATYDGRAGVSNILGRVRTGYKDDILEIYLFIPLSNRGGISLVAKCGNVFQNEFELSFKLLNLQNHTGRQGARSFRSWLVFGCRAVTDKPDPSKVLRDS